MKHLSFAVITISDRSARGERQDLSGPALIDYIQSRGGLVKFSGILPDEKDIIKNELRLLSDDPGIHVILTTGGTGLTPRDVTPQASLEVGDYEVPGICEHIRAKSSEITLHALLSRAVCVVRNQCLILNLPGSPKGALESLQIIESVLHHSVSQLRGLPDSQDHQHIEDNR